MTDNFCKAVLPYEPHPRAQAALSRSEVVKLSIFEQWQNFGNERGFYRYAERHLGKPFRSSCLRAVQTVDAAVS
jgi:hypothetical protein